MSQSLLEATRLPVSEAARRLGVHTSAMYRWRLRGDLPFVRVGGRSFVLVADLEDFVRRRSDPRSSNCAAKDVSRRADDAGQKLDALGL